MRHDVFMIHRDLTEAPRFSLPPGYGMRCYAEGDIATWVRIQQAAEQFFVPTDKTFTDSMPGDTAHLAARVMFLVDPTGAEIGTITAWDAPAFVGPNTGQIHWVAIVPAAQGRGLAKPMLSAACDLPRARGYARAWLESNVSRIPALNLYLGFGFDPDPRDEAERAAWRHVAPALKTPIRI